MSSNTLRARMSSVLLSVILLGSVFVSLLAAPTVEAPRKIITSSMPHIPTAARTICLKTDDCGTMCSAHSNDKDRNNCEVICHLFFIQLLALDGVSDLEIGATG